MPHVPQELDRAFRSAIRAAFNIDADPIVGPSQNEKFGDYQSNAAMGLAKQLKSNPRAVAEQIKSKLELREMTSDVTIAGPGFINVTLSHKWLGQALQELASDDRLAIPLAPSRQTVVIDYSGPNIAKQMHVGHLRSTIIGDALSRVIEFEGHNVIRQNHIGDWGTQFGMLIGHLSEHLGTDESLQTANLFFTREDLLRQSEIGDLERFYRRAKTKFDVEPGFADRARQHVVNLQRGESWENAVWQKIVAETRRHYQPLYNRMNVRLELEHERGESFYNPFLPEVVKELTDKGLAVKSEGAVAVFVDGPDKSPLIIQKSDGGYLYGTTDLAGVRYRIMELHADRIIYTHDSRQAQHFRQVFETAHKASWTRNGQVSLEYAPFGTMLGEDGKPFKSRSGDTIKLVDLLDEAEERALKVVTEKNPELPEEQRKAIAKSVGIGAIKYADLSKDRISDYVFSWDKMLSLDGNTAPYLQYAYARIRSIFRKAGNISAPASMPLLESPHELALVKHIIRLPEVVETVARELKPHHLCTYLYELASKFSGFYENCPVLQSNEPTRSSRLLLCELTARTMAQGLDLLGIEHPEQM
jgi:arginyl-tRNA synthetase